MKNMIPLNTHYVFKLDLLHTATEEKSGANQQKNWQRLIIKVFVPAAVAAVVADLAAAVDDVIAGPVQVAVADAHMETRMVPVEVDHIAKPKQCLEDLVLRPHLIPSYIPEYLHLIYSPQPSENME